MGILRIYLALCVVAAHSEPILPWGMHSGPEAVQIFFVISGFYMALIYEKYQSSYHFYFSRFLRIFIPYWIIALGIVIASVVLGLSIGFWGELEPYRGATEKNGWPGLILVTVSNITIFGQDAVMFLSNDINEPLAFTSYFENCNYPLWHYLIVQQGWSLALELLFYLCMPLLAKLKTSALVALIAVSLFLRICCYEFLGWDSDPWNYRFFPFELALFASGMLGFKVFHKVKGLFAPLLNRNPKSEILEYVVLVFLLLVLFRLSYGGVFFAAKFIGTTYAQLVSYLVWAALVPFIFYLSSRSRVDRFIGELSYPVYLMHFFFIYLIMDIFVRTNTLQLEVYTGLITAAISVCLSIFLVKTVVLPLDVIRYSLAERMAKKFAGKG